jgi:hypothetical protein
MMVLAGLLLGACATSYQPVGATGGYSETRVNERSYVVRFEGNGFTSSTRAQQGALRRAAELTAHHGYPTFLVVSSQTGDDTTTHDGTGTSKPHSSVTIKMLTAVEAAALPSDVIVYDAKSVLTGTGAVAAH